MMKSRFPITTSRLRPSWTRDAVKSKALRQDQESVLHVRRRKLHLERTVRAHNVTTKVHHRHRTVPFARVVDEPAPRRDAGIRPYQIVEVQPGRFPVQSGLVA